MTRCTPMASMPEKRMGLPPRSLTADAHDCIMVRSPVGSAEYKDVARAIFVPPLGRLASGRLVLLAARECAL